MSGAVLIGTWIGFALTMAINPDAVPSSLAFSLGCTWMYAFNRLAKAKGE